MRIDEKGNCSGRDCCYVESEGGNYRVGPPDHTFRGEENSRILTRPVLLDKDEKERGALLPNVYSLFGEQKNSEE